MKKKYLEAIFIPIIFAVLIAWFFKDALFSGQIFAERDLSRYYYPLRFFAVNCIKSGIFPLWNPYIFCGNPLFAGLQSCVLYPASIIYYLGDFARMFNVFIVAHFFLAAIFTYIFMRNMGYSVFAGFLSGVAFSLSGYMTSVVNLVTTLSSVAWFPLAMLFYYKMIKGAPLSVGTPLKEVSPRGAPFKYAILLGIIFLIMFLAGEPSVLYMTIVLFFCGSVYFTIEEYIERRGTARRAPTFNYNYIKSILFAVIIFLGLSAFQLLPFIEFLRISSRQDTSFLMASIWNFPIKDSPGIIWPFFHDIYKVFINYWQRQSWLDNYYAGVLVFMLFLITVFLDKTRKARAILILGLVGFAISLGKDAVLFSLLHDFVPGFKAMRYSVRFFFIPAFAVCVLAGAGLDYYIKRIKSDDKLKAAAFIALTAAFISSIMFLALEVNFQGCLDILKAQAIRFAWGLKNMPRAYVADAISQEVFLKFLSIDLLNLKRLFLLVAFFGMLFFLGTKKGVRVSVFVAPALVFLALADVFQVNGGYSPLVDIKKFTAPPENVSYLIKEKTRGPLFRFCCSPQASREHSYVPETDFYKGVEASKDRLITDRMVEFGLYDVNMYGSVYNKRNSDLLNIIMKGKAKNLEKLLALLNVRFVASPKEPGVGGFRLVKKSGPANLYETDYYLPRVFLVEKAVVIKDEAEILKKLREGDFDPAKEVILEDENCRGTLQRAPTPSGTDTATIASYAPNKVIIDATVSGTAKFLILSDTYYPGWKVFVDGKQHKLLRADYILRAVQLEPGIHRVEFIYSPFSFKIGVLISLLSLLILLTYIFYYNIIR